MTPIFISLTLQQRHNQFHNSNPIWQPLSLVQLNCKLTLVDPDRVVVMLSLCTDIWNTLTLHTTHRGLKTQGKWMAAIFNSILNLMLNGYMITTSLRRILIKIYIKNISNNKVISSVLASLHTSCVNNHFILGSCIHTWISQYFLQRYTVNYSLQFTVNLKSNWQPKLSNCKGTVRL